MKMILVAAVIGLAACGGNGELFKGDEIVAELSNGQPLCSSGASGPTLHTTETETTFRETSADPGITYTSTTVTCQWTCGHSEKFGFTRAFVEAVFYTDHTGKWQMDALHVDPYQNRVVCPN